MKGSECRHLFTRRCGSDGTRIYFPRFTAWESARRNSAEPHHLRCDRCDVLLPFGPANDTPEALVELRAAELAADPGHGGHAVGHLDDAHCPHWRDDEGPCCRCGYAGAEETPCDVGHLAICIATHTTEPTR